MRSTPYLLALALTLAAACAPPAPSSTASTTTAPDTSRPGRSLRVLTRAEPVDLSVPAFHSAGIAVNGATRLFQAGLVVNDAQGLPRPYLATALPVLNTDTWKVLPDGRMETTYSMKPNLVWHDGEPLTADDFTFTRRVQVQPELGGVGSGPAADITDITAPSPNTIVIAWKRPRPEAGSFDPGALPKHLLGAAFEKGDWDAFLGLPFWTREYVGLGPYKLAQWDPGASIQGTAFDKHVLGKPRIEKIVISWSSDENTALANILSENVDVVSDRSIRFEQTLTLKEKWAADNHGTYVLTPSMNRWMVFQQRPEFATPQSLLDLRVRKAVTSAIDRATLNEGLFQGAGVMAVTLVRPNQPYYAEVDKAITKYPYDPRQTDQFLTQAGYAKGADGIYATASGEKFAPVLMNQAGAQPERETALMIETWRRAGIDAQAKIIPVSQSSDNEQRATFAALQNASGGSGEEAQLRIVTSKSIGTPANRWAGGNRGGWSNPDYDKLSDTLDVTLDPAERVRYVVQMEKFVSDQLPVVHLFYNFAATAYLAGLEGPDPTVVNDSLLVWNIYDWRFK